MKNELRFAAYAIHKNIKGSAELRTSFITNIFGMMINNVSFVIIWVFFVRSVGIVNGWTAADIIALQGFTSIGFSGVFTLGAGITQMAEYIESGSFDSFMISPKNLLMRIATSAFSTPSLGDFFFGVICLVLYAFFTSATFFQIVLLFFFSLTGCILFTAVLIIAQSIAFFFPHSASTSRSIFELFLTPSLFHGGAFQGALRFFFTFIIPSLAVSTLPVEAIREMSLHKIGLVTLITISFFALGLCIFHTAVKRYESSNFMTFGR